MGSELKPTITTVMSRRERVREKALEHLDFYELCELLDTNLFGNQRRWHDLLEEHNRMLIEASVGHGKSTWLFPEIIHFILDHHMRGVVPRILFVTGREELCKTYTTRIARAMESTEIQDIFGEAVQLPIGKGSPWKDTALRLSGQPSNIKEPTWFSSGPTGGIEGTRCNWAILDDFIDVEQARSPADRRSMWLWYGTTLRGRMDPDARLTIIGSSWHPDDAYSRIRQQAEMGSDVAHFKFPCYNADGSLLCPEWWTRESLEKARLDIGETLFRLRYLMDNDAMMRATFDESWITYIDELPPGIELGQAWDFAITSKAMADARKTDPDYTCCATVGYDPTDDKLVLAGLFLDRIDSNHDKHILREWERWDRPRHVYCETNAFQQLIMEMVMRHCPEVPVVGVKNTSTDKVTRILSLQKYFQVGWKVYTGIEPLVLQELVRQYTHFPLGTHDDILDAMQMIAVRLKEGRVTGIDWDI